MGRHHAAGSQRMDLLDRVREEVGNEAQAHRLGLLEPEGWQAPALLLAGMPPPLRRAKPRKLTSAHQPKADVRRLSGFCRGGRAEAARRLQQVAVVLVLRINIRSRRRIGGCSGGHIGPR